MQALRLQSQCKVVHPLYCCIGLSQYEGCGPISSYLWFHLQKQLQGSCSRLQEPLLGFCECAENSHIDWFWQFRTVSLGGRISHRRLIAQTIGESMSRHQVCRRGWMSARRSSRLKSSGLLAAHLLSGYFLQFSCTLGSLP